MLVGIARAVAACAACRGMSALQREAGAGMIERHGLPRTCLVAGRAVRAPAAAVRIVLRVAGDACRAQAFPALPGMARQARRLGMRSEEHTSELQSLMRNSYAVFCLKKKKHKTIMSRKTSSIDTRYRTP